MRSASSIAFSVAGSSGSVSSVVAMTREDHILRAFSSAFHSLIHYVAVIQVASARQSPAPHERAASRGLRATPRTPPPKAGSRHRLFWANGTHGPPVVWRTDAGPVQG